MDQYLAEIRIFGGNFAPQGWALCLGQLMSISQNSALFSLLGTTYGGDGVSTFALPNLAGRSVLGFGTSTTGVPYAQGQSSGHETVTVTSNNLPSHTHAVSQPVNNANADLTDPTGAMPAVVNDGGGRSPVPYPAYTKNTTTGVMASQQTGPTGGSNPVSIMQPYLVVNYIIATTGIFPSRS